MKIYIDSRDEMLAIVQRLVERGLGFTVYVDLASQGDYTYTIQLTGAY